MRTWSEEAQEHPWRFGPRWWLSAAIAFAGIEILFVPVAMALFWGMMVAIGFGGGPLPLQWLAGAIGLGLVPMLISSGLATVVEIGFRRAGKPDRARHWTWRTLVTVLVAGSPGVILPGAFIVLLGQLGGTDEELAAIRRKALRPIAESDTVGFCSVPKWAIVDGYPQLTLAVRIDEAGSYTLTADGDCDRRPLPGGWSSRASVRGLTVRTLTPGVDTMTVRLEMALADSIPWPVTITSIQLSREGEDEPIDYRSGHSLYVISPTDR